MNLDFGILWIEDSYSAEEEASLRRRVLDAGFIARIETIPNGQGIEKLARDNTSFHNYDIILLDYKLQDESGNELAPKVRALFPSTTILFYSGSVGDAELRTLIAAKEVEGVYCSARTRFIARAGELIEQTAKSLDRLSGMRGLAMRVVAECDAVMREAALSMSRHDKACADKLADLDKDVEEFFDGLQKGYEASKTGDLSDRLDTRAVDSAKLFKHFRRLTQVVAANPKAFGLVDQQVERLRELRRTSAQYDEKVLRKRNLLGHVVEERAEKGWVLTGSDEITLADFPEMRRVFAAHIDAFRELRDLVSILDRQKAD